MNEHKPHISLRQNDIAIAYLLLRLLIGFNFLNRGITRTADIPGFVAETVEQLQNSYIPEFLVTINSYLVPPVQLIVGILITLGLVTRGALIATFILMIMLKIGVTSIQNWGAATSMLSYGLVLFILLAGLSFNIYSIDHWIKTKKTAPASTTSYEQSRNNFFAFRFGKKRRRHRLPTQH
jgi:thiosulfate dehydrogenase [quinone] large subunit